MQEMIKSTVWHTFRTEWLVTALFSVIGESTGVFSCYYISFLINYIREEDAEITDGIRHLCIFIAACIGNQLCRNFYIFTGFVTAIKMRKTLVDVIFNKVCHLSMKSLIATNSGKLISVISGDLFAAERSLSFAPLILACPIVNIFTYVIIGLTSHWINAVIVFCIWIFMILAQNVAGRIAKRMKAQDSALAD